MERIARLSSPVALAVGLLSAAAAVALAIRGPINGLDLVLTVTAVAFVSTTLVGMAVLSVGIAGWLTAVLWRSTRTQHLTLAVGSPNGETYVIGQALKTVIGAFVARLPAGV